MTELGAIRRRQPNMVRVNALTGSYLFLVRNCPDRETAIYQILGYSRQILCSDRLKRKPSKSIPARRRRVSFRMSRIFLLNIWYNFVVNASEIRGRSRMWATEIPSGSTSTVCRYTFREAVQRRSGCSVPSSFTKNAYTEWRLSRPKVSYKLLLEIKCRYYFKRLPLLYPVTIIKFIFISLLLLARLC